jgi:hypothetical protein
VDEQCMRNRQKNRKDKGSGEPRPGRDHPAEDSRPRQGR